MVCASPEVLRLVVLLWPGERLEEKEETERMDEEEVWLRRTAGKALVCNMTTGAEDKQPISQGSSCATTVSWLNETYLEPLRPHHAAGGA